MRLVPLACAAWHNFPGARGLAHGLFSLGLEDLQRPIHSGWPAATSLGQADHRPGPFPAW
jgi:hypothetical protein